MSTEKKKKFIIDVTYLALILVLSYLLLQYALPLLRCWPRGWACPASRLPVPSAGASCWRLRCRIIFGRAGSYKASQRGKAKNGGQGAGRRFFIL